MKVEYDSNNSGGNWWLKDEDWYALEQAGWVVEWRKDSDDKYGAVDDDGRWLGALATSATREGLDLASAIAEWEHVTGQNARALGCGCCGAPHSFTLEHDGKFEHYYPEAPEYGQPYEAPLEIPLEN